jgi:hypothetical protein
MVARRLALLLVLVAAAAPALHAYVPPAERIHGAIAATNKADGRDQAVRLELSMQIGERPGVATGELVSHPTGLARLELQGAGGLIERHLLQGNELMVTRNGQPLDDPRAFLLPFFLLQADRADTLRAALTSFSVLPDQIGLAECGDADCLVIGDPTRTVSPPDPPPVRGLDRYEAIKGRQAGMTDAGTEASAAGSALGPGGVARDGVPRTGAAASAWPRLWVETGTFEIRGFDGADGVKIRLGPIASFEELRVPAWITIEEPGRAPARLEVLGATQVTAPASAFSRDWLYAVESPSAPPAGAALDADPAP